ncbi:hypothetical protein GOBAR_DD02002 [Gossypium barbadense]|nr:hypothetical protein GOBAR_DD02002 [Gossypium barbadense]
MATASSAIVYCTNATDKQISYANNSSLQVSSSISSILVLYMLRDRLFRKKFLSVIFEDNKGNLYIAKTSHPNVSKAYSEQHRNDFSRFLRFRSEEMITKGRMLLTFIGRSITDPTSKDCCTIWDLFTKSLLDLVAEGLVCESDVDSFNVPYYYPCKEEVREIIEKEGSFVLNKLEIFEVNWDFEDDVCNENFVLEKTKSGRNVANCILAITESMIASHFGDTIIDDLFSRFAQHVGEHLSCEKTKYYVTIVVSMTLK